MPRPTRPLLVGSTLYVVALVVIALWPTHIDASIDVVDGTFVGRWLLGRGLTHGEVYDLIEFWSNVALYLPLGLLAMMLSARVRWWHAVTLSFAVSATFEALQAGLRPGRTADVTDIVANTLGATLGATIFVIGRFLRRARTT